ncbi:hypothetical protein PENTCL1PPCAC_9896 [Pristionchus entomophagus]|uniref:Uncharacterized protein n=1 Tax=Pristionchus entomophagus TaxID=358040 RepID=A0AAV5SWZ2_9BILA|nr:hypothetical protein PENTCL1PPCAC_9896 [Pristionchus entomophagus]
MRLLIAVYSRFSLPATVAITVATVITYAVSQAMFQHWIIDIIDMVRYFTIREGNLERYEIVRTDYQRLLKMKGFWPPHAHPGIAWAYSFGLYFLFTKMMVIGADYSIRPISRDNSLFLSQSAGTKILNSLVAAAFIFSTLFPLYRLGEMHFAVIILNLVHYIVTCTCSNFVFSSILNRFARDSKEKQN